MDKNIIRSVVDKSIISVKHNQFRSNINRVLREITDTKEEYDDLKKSVWHFWKKAHDSQVELMGIMDYNHNSYTSVGFESEVAPDYNGIYTGITEGIYYDAHNHPNNSCFQSYNDLEGILIMNSKYAYTIGDDGFMIIKNTNKNLIDPDSLEYNYDKYTATKVMVDMQKKKLSESPILSSYNTIQHKLMEKFKKEYKNQLENIREDCIVHNTEFDIDDVDFAKYTSESNKLFHKYLKDNVKDNVNALSNEFEKNNVNTIKVRYCGKYERKKDQ